MGEQIYPEMYDVNYFFKTPSGESTVRVTSDGKGKVREEQCNGNLQTVTITDYKAKFVYTISETIKLVKRASLKTPYENPSDIAKTKEAKDLGVKSIHGLTCQGWRYKEQGNETEIWLDKRAGFVVVSKSKIQNLEIEMVLKDLNKAEPKSELFNIPNYRVIAE